MYSVVYPLQYFIKETAFGFVHPQAYHSRVKVFIFSAHYTSIGSALRKYNKFWSVDAVFDRWSMAKILLIQDFTGWRKGHYNLDYRSGFSLRSVVNDFTQVLVKNTDLLAFSFDTSVHRSSYSSAIRYFCYILRFQRKVAQYFRWFWWGLSIQVAKINRTKINNTFYLDNILHCPDLDYGEFGNKWDLQNHNTRLLDLKHHWTTDLLDI